MNLIERGVYFKGHLERERCFQIYLSSLIRINKPTSTRYTDGLGCSPLSDRRHVTIILPSGRPVLGSRLTAAQTRNRVDHFCSDSNMHVWLRWRSVIGPLASNMETTPDDLGSVFDQHLSFKPHITELSQPCRKKTYTINHKSGTSCSLRALRLP